MELITKSSTYLIHDFISGKNKPNYIGFKGTSFIEAGYIFAPYIPMVLEGEFEPRRSLASRYATKVVNSDFYSRITINEVYNGVQLPNVNRSFV
jgi:hypothetical protein